MLEGNQYIDTVKAYFEYLINEFGFNVLEVKKRGNAFYDVQYKDEARIVSISYENIEDYLLVIVFLLQNGELPNYDDKTRTLHLNQLNAKILSLAARDEVSLNSAYFLKFHTKSDLEKKLLKTAKELRLCLKHLNQLPITQ